MLRSVAENVRLRYNVFDYCLQSTQLSVTFLGSIFAAELCVEDNDLFFRTHPEFIAVSLLAF